MLNLVNVSRIAGYSTQEIVASLVYRRRFNSFDGEVVVTDLARYRDLWSSFWFTRPVYTPDTTGRGIRNLVEMLLQIASSQQRWSLNNSYMADTLYVLAQKDDAVVSQLISLGEKWQADSIELIDGDRHNYSRRLQQQLAKRLKQSLYVETNRSHMDAVVICYWWDRSSMNLTNNLSNQNS